MPHSIFFSQFYNKVMDNLLWYLEIALGAIVGGLVVFLIFFWSEIPYTKSYKNLMRKLWRYELWRKFHYWRKERRQERYRKRSAKRLFKRRF